jgi:hypothetical protein
MARSWIANESQECCLCSEQRSRNNLAFTIKRASDQDARPVFRRSHRLPRKGYQQDALFAVNKDELSPVNEVHRDELDFGVVLFWLSALVKNLALPGRQDSQLRSFRMKGQPTSFSTAPGLSGADVLILGDLSTRAGVSVRPLCLGGLCVVFVWFGSRGLFLSVGTHSTSDGSPVE